jgi:hypothetical protein
MTTDSPGYTARPGFKVREDMVRQVRFGLAAVLSAAALVLTLSGPARAAGWDHECTGTSDLMCVILGESGVIRCNIFKATGPHAGCYFDGGS